MGLGADLVALVVLAVKLVATAFHGLAPTAAAPPAAVQTETVAEPAAPSVPPADGLDESAPSYL